MTMAEPRREATGFGSRICGDEDVLLIEAPAGHGKTHEAVEAARAFAPHMKDFQKVLLLSHTNSAAREFAQRPKSGADVQTLDSFILGIVRTYGRYFGLEPGFAVGDHRVGAIPFKKIRTYAADLLESNPKVTEAISFGYPVILVDEFQDTSLDQMRVVDAITSSSESKLRLFGDPMQAVYNWDEEAKEFVNWVDAAARLPTIALDIPHRWVARPELGHWLLRARRLLQEGSPIDLSDRPECVRVQTWTGSVPKWKNEKGDITNCIAPLSQLCRRDSEKRVFLFRNGGQASQVSRRGVPARFVESKAGERILSLMAGIRDAGGSLPRLAGLLIEFLRNTGTNIEKTWESQAPQVCGENGMTFGPKKKIRRMAPAFEKLYENPDIYGFAEAVFDCEQRASELGWKPFRSETLSLLRDLPRDAGEGELEDAVVAKEKQINLLGGSARKELMTIHKSKGREYDSVVLPFLSEGSHPMTEEEARVLYVALSRAKREIVLMIPSEDPTGWFTGVPSS